MNHHRPLFRSAAIAAALLVSAGIAVAARAQTAAQPPSPAAQAVGVRKAVFTLIGANCKILGDVAKGNVPFDSTEVQKRAERVAFLSGLVGDSFPDISNVGEPDSKAKPDIWTSKDDFAKKAADLREHAAALVRVSAAEKGTTDAFKAAFNAVAQDCKGCHDTYRAK